MANFDLSKLMEGKNPQSVMLAETRELKSKWEQTGLLEGLGEREQSQISVLLENQAKQLLDEATQTGTSAGSEEWSGVALPLVRRIFGEIASKEFVSVQPMNLPSGLIFYLDFKYGTAQPGNPGFSGKSLFGGDGSDLGSTNVAENGLYGEGRFGYSINDVSDDVAVADLTFATASWAEVGFDSSLSASIAAGAIQKITFDNGSTNDLTRPDIDGVRSFYISSSDFSSADAFYPAHSSATAAGAFTFFANCGAGAVKADDLTVKYSQQPIAENRGDFEDGNADGVSNVGDDLGIPEVDLELKSEAIVAKTRKLKAVWTPELAQDLNAYHSIDAEAELTSMLSEYISLEIDLEILDMLKANALTTEYWSVTLGEEYNGSSWVTGGAAAAYTKNSWFQTLGAKLNKVSNKIHQLTLRGGANFGVASPGVCTLLESIPGFTVSAG
jgi:hypothetical protein